MSARYCLICNDDEPSEYNPGKGTDFICSRCVQILLAADQDQLNRAYQRAREKRYINQAHAIESFLHEGAFDHERKTKKPKRSLVRKKISRVAGPSRDQLWT